MISVHNRFRILKVLQITNLAWFKTRSYFEPLMQRRDDIEGIVK